MTDETRSPEDELRMAIQQVSRGIRNNRGDETIGDTALAVLWHLNADAPLTPTELAVREHVTPPSMNRTLNGLEEAGLVTRAKSEDDARKVLVALTPAARDLLEETRRLRTAWFSRRLETLAPEERDALLAVAPLLRRLMTP
ncbi:MarR family winged helix-turn-helix transcriptional regulator [Pseudolysinimonas sp.]